MEIADFEPKIMEILRSSDMATVTPKAVRERLQIESAIPLDDHKKALKALIGKCYDKVNDENASLKNEIVKPDIVRKSPKAPKAPRASKAKKEGEKKKRELDPAKREKNPFTRTWGLSSELMAVTNESELSRPGVVKALWKYIKEHDLQDPSDKKYILCDDKLKAVFNQKERVHCFSMNKDVGKHLYDLPAPPPAPGAS